MLRAVHSTFPLFALLAVGCVGTSIGDPCLPEAVPEGGFVSNDTYVETSSTSCETRVCLVRGLDGDPSSECIGDRCAPEAEVREHVYCTAACAADTDCPDGFRCADIGASGQLCIKVLPDDL